MKKAVSLFVILLALQLGSCEKHDNYADTGNIIGPDLAMCICCGGYFIEINSVLYRFEKSELPAGFTFSDDQLPLHVQLNWQRKAMDCPGRNGIIISKIKIIK